MDYSKSCAYSSRLLQKLESIDLKKQLDFDLINEAIYWAKKYHDGQFRKSGEPFYSHPLEVAYMVSDYNLKTDVIVTAILHDIIEDTAVTAGMILDTFGWRIAAMVDMLTRDRPDGTKLSVKQVLYNAHKKGDKEVLLIKCIDRLHNLKTIGAKSPEKICKTIKDSSVNFILLSEYLGLPVISKIIHQICTQNKEKLTVNKYSVTKHNFSFNDNYQPLSLIFQNN